MIRIAGERIHHLLALAEEESRKGPGALPDRYVRLARRIGTRYNVRVPKGYRELYCRSCSAYWVEGRTVRTRLRSGLRTRTCLRCGAIFRQRNAPPVAAPEPNPAGGRREAAPQEPQLAFAEDEEEARAELEGGEEGE
jgi:ribonuclease P protein subunit RPR2